MGNLNDGIDLAASEAYNYNSDMFFSDSTLKSVKPVEAKKEEEK